MKTNCVDEKRNLIGAKVKELRTKEGISQKLLAARLQTEGSNLTDLMILRIEKGTRFVSDFEVAALARYFKISADELLGITQEKEKGKKENE